MRVAISIVFVHAGWLSKPYRLVLPGGWLPRQAEAAVTGCRAETAATGCYGLLPATTGCYRPLQAVAGYLLRCAAAAAALYNNDSMKSLKPWLPELLAPQPVPPCGCCRLLRQVGQAAAALLLWIWSSLV